MAQVKLKNIIKDYSSLRVIHGVDLTIESGEFTVFVGPSGCGKSTLLRMIAGLEEITDGEMSIDGEIVNDIVPAERGVAMVFQSYALYPHMTVFDNMAFGLKQAKIAKPEIEKRVGEAAEILQITPYLDRLPKHLSGGQRQRVAIGRAIVRDPKVFLFDEPLSNLDAALRVQTRFEIGKLHTQLEATMIYVTHDQVEAMTLADRIVVLNFGVIEQVGSPLELYKTPRNRFVAEFIGSPKMNIIPVTQSGTTITLPSGQTSKAAKSITGCVFLGVRPEHLEVTTKAKALISGTVSHIEQLGENALAYVTIDNEHKITTKLESETETAVGDVIHLGAPTAKLHYFDGDELAIR